MRVLARPRRLPSIACMTQIGVPAAKDTPPGDDGAANRLSASGSGRLGAILRYDLPASLVVFLVALPLSLGIAVASGAPPLAGLIAAIVGGVVAGLLGGSPLQVSGPAAGLTVIVAGLVAEFGWKVTCAITVCAGLLQIVFGLTRLGRAALAISPMVVHAMLAGIGITIALQQVHVLLGGETHSSAVHNLVDLPVHLTHAQLPGMWLGLLVIAIMVGWGRWRRIVEARSLVFLGRISFSLYIIHFAFVDAIHFLIRRLLPAGWQDFPLTRPLAALVILALSVIAAPQYGTSS